MAAGRKNIEDLILNRFDPITLQSSIFMGVSAMSALQKSYHIKSRDFIRAGEASIKIQTLLKSLNYHPQLVRRVAICGYEGEMNVVMHGGDGSLSITINTEKLIMEISDDGPGIVDIEKAMQTGFSTASDEHREMGFGAGMGLPNMKKNADEITVESEKSQGTRVRMVFSIDKGGDGG
jgi:anti-sigma regulatory factor (Ser/Thr protein kinase)